MRNGDEARPLAVLEKQFRAACRGPDALGLTGARLSDELSGRTVPLLELRPLVWRPQRNRRLADRVWSELVANAQWQGPRWLLGPVGMMIPRLERAAARIIRWGRHERTEVESELVLGVISAVLTVDPALRGLAWRLEQAACRRAAGTPSVTEHDPVTLFEAELLDRGRLSGHGLTSPGWPDLRLDADAPARRRARRPGLQPGPPRAPSGRTREPAAWSAGERQPPPAP